VQIGLIRQYSDENERKVQEEEGWQERMKWLRRLEFLEAKEVNELDVVELEVFVEVFELQYEKIDRSELRSSR
jgi:hypothetical protein